MNKQNKKSSILRVLSYFKYFKHLIIPAMVFVIVVSLMDFMPVAIIDQLTTVLGDNTRLPNDAEKSELINDNSVKSIHRSRNIRQFINQFIDVSTDRRYFTFIMVLGLFVAVIKFVSFYLSNFLIDYIGRKAIYSIKKDLFSVIVYLPLRYFEKSRIGNTLSIINNDVIIVQDLVRNIVMNLIKELFSIAFILLYMIMINPILILVLVVVGPISIILTGAMGKKIRSIEKNIRSKFSDITEKVVEVLNNILVVKSFAMEDKERCLFDKESKAFLEHEKQSIRIKSANNPFLELTGFLAVLFILMVGGYQILDGGLILSDLVTFATALALLSAPVQKASKGFLYIKQASASAERIFNLMDEEQEDPIDSEKEDIPDIIGNVKFDNISFSYSESNTDKVLSEINIDIKSKQTLAVVGLSGSGKSTLVKLIPRLINPQSGQILIDGNDTSQYNLRSIRQQISMVTQDIMLFHGTISENICYGKPDATKDEIIEASKTANAYNFIVNLMHGFDTEIGENGIRLSGGQRQRIAMARALIKKPKILILDEATSSLDTESERAIQKSFLNLNHQQTTIVIAHRLSTIVNSDKIVVVDCGKIVETGNHSELLKRNGIYKRLYELQFKSHNDNDNNRL